MVLPALLPHHLCCKIYESFLGQTIVLRCLIFLSEFFIGGPVSRVTIGQVEKKFRWLSHESSQLALYWAYVRFALRDADVIVFDVY